MKILVTGATGYLGHNLALRLAQLGHTVNILVRNKKSAFIPSHPAIHIYPGDIRQRQTIQPAIAGCNQVYHTAAMVQHTARRRSDIYDVNVEGTVNILDLALQNGVEKIVFTSTCGVIGPSLKEPMTESDPRIVGFSSDYDLSKHLAEKVTAEYIQKGLKAVIIAPSKVFGPGIETHSISVNTVINRFIQGKPVFCPNNTSYISNYVFIDDLVEGHILAMQSGETGEKYIMGGENLSFKEFFQAIREISGMRGILIPVPASAVRLFGHWNKAIANLTGRDPVFDAGSVQHIFCNKSFSSEKAVKKLGYLITPFRQALQTTIQFLKHQPCAYPSIQ